MPVYKHHKCIFTHIPKSAGTSIHNVLRGKDMQGWSDHKTLSQNISASTKDYFKFTYVRNPWDRFVSSYFYFKNYGRDGKGDVRMGKIVNRYSTFTKFVLDFHNIPESYWVYPHFKSQLTWIDFLPIDFIGQYELLQPHFDHVCDNIGIERQQLPHTNESKHKHYTTHYNEDTIQAVAKIYRRDIEELGYDFNGIIS